MPFPYTIFLPLAVDQVQNPSGSVINWLKVSERYLCSICYENSEFSLLKIVCFNALIKLPGEWKEWRFGESWAVEWREWRFGGSWAVERVNVWGESCQERKQKAAEEGAGDRATGMGTVGCNDKSERTTRWVLHFDLRVKTRQADEWVWAVR